jgi:hypothetical protein
MSKLHIIGIGGTGHKVLCSAIHLTACGAFKGNLGPNEITEIRVLTIDADDSNGNLSQTKNVLSAYRRYYEALSGAGTLGLVNIEPVSEDINISLYKDDKKSISKTFNIPQYAGSDDDAFIRFLYTNDEIDVEFDEGFYGHTSIGTLIVKDILKSSDIWTDQLSLINENDFVFVIGSIFGGTGASAIPVLLDELNAKQKDTNFKLAALVINPYFTTLGKIREEGILQPDSSNFHIKAKASLYYYYRQEQYKKTNALYVIGEGEANFSVEVASRGSSGQRNKAAPIELFAATALIDFVKESDGRQDGKIITAMRAEQDGACFWTWKMLQDSLPDLPANIQAVIKAAIFYNKVLYGQLKHGHAAGAWQSFYDGDLDKKRDDRQNFVYENIHEYLKLLVIWFYDIHKRNKKELNQNTGSLMWEPDIRVKLFNANYANLFDDVPVQGDIIDNFEDLVYRDTNGKKSQKIYAGICGRKPSGGSGRGFAALFAALFDIVREQEKKFGLFGKKPPEPENFASIAYLSRENNVTFTRPDEANKLWVKGEPKLLEDIADGLPINISESFTKNDIAVPSPWSIFIMNELTLTEPKFAAINKGAFREWCGIITLLALRKINRYEDRGLKLEALELGGGDGDFLRVVNSTLTPGSFIFDNPNWIKCHRVSLDGVTIAFLANNTLVCPAYSLDEKTRGKLNRIAPTIVGESHNFLNPGDYFKDQSQSLNRDAKFALKLFLTELKAIITREAGKNRGSIIGSLQRLIDSFLKEISPVTTNSNIAIEPEKKNAVHSVASLFEELCIAPSRADIELPFLMEGTKIPAALIGLNICGINSGSAEAAHYRITETLFYNQITVENINSYKNTKPDGIKLLYADELLSDSMIIIKKDGAQVFHAMPNSSSLPDYEIIWPLNEDLLELYDPETLNKMVSLTADSEKVTVSIKIKLGGKLGSHLVSKEYRIKNRGDTSQDDTRLNGICGIMKKDYIPLWTIWPYAEINDAGGNNTWKRYNCFCVEPNYVGIPVLEISPIGINGTLSPAGERELSRLSNVQRKFYYRRYAALPVAFKVSEKTERSRNCGYVFLAQPVLVTGTGSWNVGVDFGTTSTTAFYTSQSDKTPKFISLMDEYQWLPGNEEPEILPCDGNDIVHICNNGQSYSEYYFIDSKSFKQNGYVSALEEMNSSRNEGETIFDTHRIFWHNYENFQRLTRGTEDTGRKEKLRTNIKWDTDKSNSAKYLNQLLTQIVYQAAKKDVGSINFFFSYPTAFGSRARSIFCQKLKDIIKSLSIDTGLTLNFDEDHNLLTESIAAANYFIHKREYESIFFCVDIGGGSTDASIWERKEKHLFQTSIHFASRDIFIRPLKRLVYNRPSVLEAVTGDINNKRIDIMLRDAQSRRLDMDDDKFKFFIETVLFEYKKGLENSLINLKGKDQKAFEAFEYCVLIGYAGLIYYFSNIIASLLMTADDKRKINNDIPKIILGLSGKGSKLTEWISAYCKIIYAEAENFIKEKTSLTINIVQEFNNETAKTETAIGLICDLGEDGTQKSQVVPIAPQVYAGAAITVKDGTLKKDISGDYFIEANDQFFNSPENLGIEFDKNLKELDMFVEFFNRITAKTNNEIPPIHIGDYAASKNALWDNISNGFKSVLKEGRFEPPFIVMLKVFLEVYVEEYLWKKLD